MDCDWSKRQAGDTSYEIIEGIFGIGSIICLDCVEQVGEGSVCARWIVNGIMNLGGIVELSMGIYIFSTFDGSVFKGFAIAIHSIFLIIGTLWGCFAIFVYNKGWPW